MPHQGVVPATRHRVTLRFGAGRSPEYAATEVCAAPWRGHVRRLRRRHGARLNELLLRSDRSDADVATEITGLEAEHPLHAAFVDRVRSARG